MVLALHFINLLFAGTLAGSEIGIHYGVGDPPSTVSDTAGLQMRQAATRRLRILIPALFLVTAITGVLISVWSRFGPYARLRWAALLCLAIWIVTRALVTVPINSAVLDWDATSPPEGWQKRIDIAQRFHIVGVWASLCAFILFLAADFVPVHSEAISGSHGASRFMSDNTYYVQSIFSRPLQTIYTAFMFS